MKWNVLFGALIIAAAILINGYLDRRPMASYAVPSRGEVKAAVVKGFNTWHRAYSRDEKADVTIKKIDYSDNWTLIRVQFSMKAPNGKQWQSGVVLKRGEFGEYVGSYSVPDYSMSVSFSTAEAE